MRALIGLWLVCEAIIGFVCFIEDEPKVAIAISAFLTLLCAGSYLIAT